MRAPEKQKDRLEIPLMYAFRESYASHDSDKREDARVGGERLISERSSTRRRGVSEALLRADLSIDLSGLLDTIDLDSAIGLGKLEFVRRSILNFGLYDLTHVILADDATDEVIGNLRRALLQHEPRLVPETLRIRRTDSSDDVGQRIRFAISAEMRATPLDVPVEFVAELDAASGKMVVQSGGGT